MGTALNETRRLGAPPGVRLTIYREGQPVMEHPLPRPVTALGRHTDNDIVLDDLALSRFHARVEQRADQHVVVDLGSQNGVYVNGVRIQGEQVLRPGDRIGIGRYVAVYELHNAPSRPPPATDVQSEADAFGGPSLLLLYNGTEMERFPLNGEGFVIGRSHKCDIVIGLLGLSRRHARVFADSAAADRWCVEDLGSQNGTFVNDARIEGAHTLRDGDTINFFEYALVFRQGQGPRTGTEVTAPQGPPSGIGTTSEVPQQTLVERAPSDLADGIGLSDDGIDGDATGFEGGRTELESALPRTSTRTGATNPFAEVESTAEGLEGAYWPGERQIEELLTASTLLARAGVLEVRVDNRLLTEVPLDRAALRIGSDARCDVALPPLTAISGWHLVVVRMGGAVLLTRVGEAALPRVGGRAVCQAFLKDGDRVELGRVTLVYRNR